MTRFASLLMFVLFTTALSEESIAQEPSLTEATAELQRLGAEVRTQKRVAAPPPREVRDAICISDSWTGGDEGVKYVEQFFRDSSERFVDLFLFGSPEISADRIEVLRTRNPTLRIREYPSPMLGIMTRPNENAAHVDGVLPGSPADKAGLKIGDVIVSIDGQHVSNRITLLKLIRTFKIGQTITIGVRRNQHERSIEATLASYESLFIEPANQTKNRRSP